MLNIKHLKTLLIFWILIMQYCVFTETLMAKKYSPINRCRDAWCWHEDRIKRQKLIELAQRKRGIHKKRDPLQLKIRAFQGGLVSDQSRMENQSIALHWKNWGIGQTQSNYQIEGQHGIKYESTTHNNDLLYTFGRDFNFTLGVSLGNRGKAKVQFLEHYYQSEQVESQGFHLGTGMTWGIFEILIRRSSLDYQYSDLERQGSVKLGKDLKVKSVVWSLGLGLSF
jgi:hypothetical protein